MIMSDDNWTEAYAPSAFEEITRLRSDLATAQDRLKFLCDAVGRMEEAASEEVYRRVTEARTFLERTANQMGGDSE